MTIQNPSTEITTDTTTTSYAELQAAATGANPRVYLKVINTDDTDNIILAVGAEASEVAIATIAPGTSFELGVVQATKHGFNLVPQGRLAVKGSANTPAYNAVISTISALLLRD